MDIIRLYRDFGVDHVTQGHKHARPGWVNVECPFCKDLPNSNPGYHLGWNVEDEYFKCWRCGWKPPVKAVMALTNMTFYDVQQILPAYGVNRTYVKQLPKGKLDFTFPSGTTEIWEPHRKYLRTKRNFDPDKIEKLWGIKGTGPVSNLKRIDKTLVSYRFRIIIPFQWNGQTVSFDARDITEKQQNKYQACPKEREVIEHKKILYGNQEEWIDTGIGTEGPTDVWRLGPLSCATSGIEYTHAQVKLIARTFKRFAVVFDDEFQAQQQALKLVADLKFRGVDAWNVKVKGDPGGLKQHEADELVKSIIKKK